MMAIIDPSALRSLREGKNWSQAQLSERAKIDKQTIWRIENAKQRSTRDWTVERLATVLGVAPAVLLGHSPAPDTDPAESISKSQLNIRISNAARNALTLVTRRYASVTSSDIIELAPFLFCWAAEQSLQWRRERLAELEQAAQAADRSSTVYGLALDQVADAIAAQRHSIEHRDVLGEWPMLSYQQEHRDAEDFWYDEESTIADGPFVAFLRQLVSDFNHVIAFEGWRERPEYRVCPDEASELVGGDPERANEILDGVVPLHELPKDLRVTGKYDFAMRRSEAGDETERSMQRADWVRQKAEAVRRQRLDELAAFLGGPRRVSGGR